MLVSDSTGFIDAYAVLGVRPDASQEELKAAHLELVRRHHPDRVTPDEQEAATRRVQRLNMAYGLVRDQRTRSRYDALRRRRAAQQAAEGDLAPVDAALASAWEELVGAAGRWAGARGQRAGIPREGGAARWAGRRLGRLLR